MFGLSPLCCLWSTRARPWVLPVLLLSAVMSGNIHTVSKASVRVKSLTPLHTHLPVQRSLFFCTSSPDCQQGVTRWIWEGIALWILYRTGSFEAWSFHKPQIRIPEVLLGKQTGLGHLISCKTAGQPATKQKWLLGNHLGFVLSTEYLIRDQGNEFTYF